MLQKYLQLFERAFEKLTSLGGSNSTWSDYFYDCWYRVSCTAAWNCVHCCNSCDYFHSDIWKQESCAKDCKE